MTKPRRHDRPAVVVSDAADDPLWAVTITFTGYIRARDAFAAITTLKDDIGTRDEEARVARVSDCRAHRLTPPPDPPGSVT